jgi:hypothetical protein
VSDFVLDASLTLQWFLEDEADRKYSSVLASLFKMGNNIHRTMLNGCNDYAFLGTSNRFETQSGARKD